MRLSLLAIFTIALAVARANDESDTIATIQKTFDGMAAHDGSAIRSTMLPDARLYSVRNDAAPGASTALDEFVTRIASTKGDLLEKFIGKPHVSMHGRLAQVWGDYEFYRDGKFSHCGVDTVSLFKTADGWKIAALVYTVETSGCKGH